MSLWRMLGLDRIAGAGGADPRQGPSASDTVRKIIDELDHLELDRARYIAAFAYILGRVANADLEISKAETRAMERVVRDLGSLPEEEAMLVVQMVKTQTLLFGSTENYLVTREFQKMATPEQRRSLLECLFAVSAADETIATVEETEIRSIAGELNLGHADFIAARAKYLQYVAVLKNQEEPPRI